MKHLQIKTQPPNDWRRSLRIQLEKLILAECISLDFGSLWSSFAIGNTSSGQSVFNQESCQSKTQGLFVFGHHNCYYALSAQLTCFGGRNSSLDHCVTAESRLIYSISVFCILFKTFIILVTSQESTLATSYEETSKIIAAPAEEFVLHVLTNVLPELQFVYIPIGMLIMLPNR